MSKPKAKKLQDQTDQELLATFKYYVLLAGGVEEMVFPDETKHVATAVKGGVEMKAEFESRSLPPKVTIEGKKWFCTGTADTGTCFFVKSKVYTEKAVMPSHLVGLTDEDAPF